MFNKQPVDISFAKGLDTKTDPWRVAIGNFLSLVNMVFTTGSRLTKRNGYPLLTTLTEAATFLTTFNNNLTAVGKDLQAFSEGTGQWVNKGALQPATLEVLPLIRSNTNQSQLDTAIAPNGLVCTVYTDQTPTSLGTARYMYAIADSVTGQNIVKPTVIPVSSGTVTGSPRVFVLGSYFIIVFTNVITATSHLQYIAISTNTPTMITANTDIAAAYTSATTLSWDGVVLDQNLYIAYDTTSGGQAIKITYLTSTLSLVTAVTYSNSGKVTATIMSMCADVSNPLSPVIWASYYDSVSTNGFTVAVDKNLNKIISTPAQTITSETVFNLATVSSGSIMTLFYEVSNNYSYDAAIPTHLIKTVTCTSTGTVGSASILVRSLGLASKAFIINSVYYFMGCYNSTFQPTYFLMNGSGQVVSRLAYSNAGLPTPSTTTGYYPKGLPSVTVNGDDASIGYLFKDFITSQNTSTTESISKSNIYSQSGLNLVTFTIGTSNITPVEIGQALHLSGGFLWEYDGYQAVEHNFYLWPDSVEVTTSTSGGNLSNQTYQYQAVYTWTDNQGNVHFSAPSIPVSVTTTGSNVSTNTINIPTMRLTYKTSNPIKISLYRFSTAQQEFFEVTTILTPLINSTTVDSVTFTDTFSDASIVGNSLIYTTGGVIENVGEPSFNAMTLFDDRLWGIDAEDPNLLWYSKQVIEATPVEMSDLLTLYVAPSIGSKGSTGIMTALAPLDDKLIIFKANALYYINGTGPDNTGAGSQYSPPLFITSVVGSSNQQSIVFIPEGLMFQSETAIFEDRVVTNGIWLLSRGMEVVYIGAPVEGLTNLGEVDSAVTIPGTTQVRFTLSSGIILMYDYFYQQWGSFEGVPAVSSTLYQNLHTVLDSNSNILQQTPDSYLDNSNPVLLSFTTSWINLAGLQGYQRAYFFYLLGEYLSPHFLQVGIAYDYNPSIVQSVTITPDNYSLPYGVSSPYGQGTYGGNSRVEQWRIFLANQRCQSFQLTIQEIYDFSLGVPAGAGLNISGLNCLIAVARGFKSQSAKNTVGGGSNGTPVT